MLKNYLKVAFRAVRRHPVYALVSVGSLAIGFAACLVIYLYIQDEHSFDRFHPDTERLYRLTRQWEESGFRPNMPAPAGPVIASENPDVESVVRVIRYWEDPLLAFEDRAFVEEQVFFADSSFFEVFGYKLLRGGPGEVLRRPMSIVLSGSMAAKYFGDADPVGKRLAYNASQELTVTGVMADPPTNSHMRPAAVVSIESLPNVAFPPILRLWGLNAFKTYVKLKRGADPAAFARYMDTFFERHRQDSTSVVGMQELASIHLHSHLLDEFEDNGDERFLQLLSLLAGLILMIAAINYANLATARASTRGLEVGMRQAIGASRRQLLLQYLGESILVTFAAAVVAVLPAAAGLRLLNELAGKSLSLADLDATIGWMSIGAILITGFAAGVYPAVILARLRPGETLKGRTVAGSPTGVFRRGLVVLQFAVSIALIAGSLIVANQIEFLKTSDLGFDREQVLVVPIADDAMRDQFETFAAELRKLPTVVSVGGAHQYPSSSHASSTATWQGADADEEIAISGNWVYDGFIETLGIRLAAGRDLDRQRGFDLEHSVVVNEAAVRAMGWSQDEALGRWISSGLDERKEMEIVGIVRDYNFESMHRAVSPMIFYLNRTGPRYAFVRLGGGDVTGAIDGVRETWSRLTQSQPFVYSFLDEEFDRLYRREERWVGIMTLATAIAILIACLGLFGLTSYTTAQRSKEIGIRKVLGSSVSKILALLSRETVLLVTTAFVLAAPLAWIGTRAWLESFAYRADPGPWFFALAGIATLLIALLSVCYLVLRAATADPVKSLRSE